ncbi:hypothetical protein SAMN05421810_103341 [Amycolatopsis arida]|uniref:Major Facilitator Superfamily protein n=1 Tax=Amycolatopsis arida TaxID=587909 RepID=A0A1I5T062_9PSEU|nr:MFS transporter [Amycolatopsis arida]TDX96280.1 hypothetical protein CLV69_103417 [Amycolatopsis arida]SFP76412.1 hypothetical protein SAMN05421810_103341 [Amycolatopsis arida]
MRGVVSSPDRPVTLLRHVGYWRWSAGVQSARLPSAMAPLAFTLLATALTGSYRLGGVLMAVFVVAEIAGAVPAGRLLDRIGSARGLVLLLVAAAGAIAALATAAAAGAAPAVLVVLVIVPGLVAGGLSGGFRSLLAGTVDGALLPRAVAVDAMILEGVLLAGPAVVVLLGSTHALAPVAGMAVAFLLAAALVPRVRGTSSPAPAGAPARLPLRAALGWLACLFVIGHLLASIEVAALPLALRLGAPESAAAVVIAVLCGASVLGGALFAWRGRPTAGAARIFLGCFVTGGLLVAVDLGWPGLLAGVALVGGCTGPLLTTASVRLQALLPECRRAEGFSVAFVVQGTGFALGSLSVGLLPLWAGPALGAGSAAFVCALLAGRRRPADAVGRSPAAL